MFYLCILRIENFAVSFSSRFLSSALFSPPNRLRGATQRMGKKTSRPAPLRFKTEEVSQLPLDSPRAIWP